MLGVILTGHGSFATGLYQATVQIIGEQPQFTAINFPDGMSTDTLETQLTEAISQCDTGDGVVFLTDIIGGSPFRLASMFSLESQNTEVITGTNLQLLLETLLARESLNCETFREMAILSAKNGITSLWHENQKVKKPVEECQDGI